MRDVHITDNSGGGGFDALLMVGGIIVVAAIAVRVAAAVASAVAALLIMVFWVLFILVAVMTAAGVAYAIWRFRHRTVRHPGVAYVQGPGQLPTKPVRTLRAPGRPELSGDQLSLDQATVERLADALARRAGEQR
jgi:hypothetical protein